MSAPPAGAALPWIGDEEVLAKADYPGVLDALRAAFAAADRGRVLSLPKTVQRWATASGPASAHALGAVEVDQGVGAFKCWVNTPRGAQALVVGFDADAGRLTALLDAAALGSLRTAGTAAVATDLLAPAEADTLALLGTGRQALHQVRAIAHVRPLQLVRVWSPRADRRAAFAAQVADEVGIRAEACADPAATVAGAPLVTTVTRAREPFLEAGMLAPGAHVNAVGAILPANAELHADVAAAGDLVVVDDLENARRSARELSALGPDLDGVVTLGALLTGAATRPDAPRLTLFKGLGTGVADLAVAARFLPGTR